MNPKKYPEINGLFDFRLCEEITPSIVLKKNIVQSKYNFNETNGIILHDSVLNDLNLINKNKTK